VLFATASQWVARLAEAHHGGRLQQELVRLGRYPLLVVDEVGYIPFEPEAANLFFQLVSLLARVGIARATRNTATPTLPSGVPRSPHSPSRPARPSTAARAASSDVCP
jgi:hypothetical protein